MVTIIILLLILTALTSKVIYRQYINPLTIFIGVHLVAFSLLYGSDFFDTTMITIKMLSIYIISYGCFCIGIFLSSIRERKRQYLLINDKNNNEKRKHQKRIDICASILFLATLLYWSKCVLYFDKGQFFRQLLYLRELPKMTGGITFLLYLKMISIFLSPYVLYYIIFYNEKRLKYYLIIALTLFSNLAYTRNVIFYIVILDIFVIVFSRENKKSRFSFKKLVLCLGVVFGVYKFFTYTQSAFNKQGTVSGNIFGYKVSEALVTVVSYFSGALVSAGSYIEMITDTPFLGNTLRMLYSVLNIFGANVDIDVYQPVEWVYIPFRYNTAAIQFYIFSEGGWIWTVIFFFMLGYLFDTVFRWYKRTKCFTSMSAVCFVALLAVISVREYVLVRLDMLIYLFLITIFYLQDKCVFRRVRFVLTNKSKAVQGKGLSYEDTNDHTGISTL